MLQYMDEEAPKRKGAKQEIACIKSPSIRVSD